LGDKEITDSLLEPQETQEDLAKLRLLNKLASSNTLIKPPAVKFTFAGQPGLLDSF
jgi:hypothetical protein